MSPLVRDAFRLGYRVTDCGEVVSPRGRVLSLAKKVKYPTIGIWLGGRVQRLYAHHLAAYCFFGEDAFSAACVRHKNGDRQDLTKENILIGSYSENERDKPPEVRSRAASVAARARFASP